MSIVISAIGGALGLGSSIFGAYKAAQERKKMEQYLGQQDSENKSWYNQNALSDYTQRADSQNLIRQLRENLDRNNRIANNVAVVTGATPEQQAVQKEQSNRIVSDTYGNLSSIGQQYKDRVTDRYLGMKNSIASQRMGVMNASAKNYETLFSNGLNMVTDSAKSLAAGLDSKKVSTTKIP
jgi:hypothetical protein